MAQSRYAQCADECPLLGAKRTLTNRCLPIDQIKIVRGSYGWFANVIFHDKDEAKKQYAIDFWFKPDGNELKPAPISTRNMTALMTSTAHSARP
jgi:hypothetical protein